MKRKGCFYTLRITLLFLIFLLLCLYFIVPYYTISSPVVFRRIENLFNHSFDNFQISAKEISWKTIADLSMENVSIKMNISNKVKENIYIHCGNFHALLPPEAFFTTQLDFSQRNMSLARICADNISLEYDELQIHEGAFNSTLFTLPFLASRKSSDFLAMPFQGHFTANKINLGSKDIEKINVFFHNSPKKYLISKGSFFWKKSPFVFVSKTTGDETNIYLTGRDIDVKEFISDKITASSFFDAKFHVQFKEDSISYLSAVFRSQESGILEKFDVYAFTKIIPQNQIKQVTAVLNTFQKYPYTSGLIDFEFKESVFTMDFQFEGNESRYQPRLTVPVHNVKEAHQFIKLKIFPTFLREFSSIIPYLK